MSSYAQAATVALSETGGMNDESERRQGMGKSRGHELKLIFTKVGGEDHHRSKESLLKRRRVTAATMRCSNVTVSLDKADQ